VAKNEKSFSIKHILIAVAELTVSVLLICSLLSAFVMGQMIRPEFGKSAAKVLAVACAFVVCWLTARCAPQKRMYVSLTVCAAVILWGLLGKVVFFPEEPMTWSLVPIILTAGAGAGLAASGKKHRRR